MPIIETFGGDSSRSFGEFNTPGFSYTVTSNPSVGHSISTLTQSNGYNILTFNFVANGVITNFTINSGKKNCSILVIGAGGGGGAGKYWPGWNYTGLTWGVYAGGGGGAGGVYQANNVLLTPGTYPITLGMGGIAGAYYGGGIYVPPGAGQDTTFNGITAKGGNPGGQGSFGNPGGTSGAVYNNGVLIQNGYSGGSGSWCGGGGGSQGPGTAASSGGQYVGYEGGAGLYWGVNGLVYAKGGNAPNAAYTYSPGQIAPNDSYSYTNGGNGGSGSWAQYGDAYSSGSAGASGVVAIAWK